MGGPHIIQAYRRYGQDDNSHPFCLRRAVLQYRSPDYASFADIAFLPGGRHPGFSETSRLRRGPRSGAFLLCHGQFYYHRRPDGNGRFRGFQYSPDVRHSKQSRNSGNLLWGILAQSPDTLSQPQNSCSEISCRDSCHYLCSLDTYAYRCQFSGDKIAGLYHTHVNRTANRARILFSGKNLRPNQRAAGEKADSPGTLGNRRRLDRAARSTHSENTGCWKWKVGFAGAFGIS